MNNYFQNRKINIAICLIVGAALLIVGLILHFLNINILSNDRDMWLIVFIPFFYALVIFVTTSYAKNYPRSMRKEIIEENDERLCMMCYKADSIFLRVMLFIRNLLFLGLVIYFEETPYSNMFSWLFYGSILLSFLGQKGIRMYVNSIEKNVHVQN